MGTTRSRSARASPGTKSPALYLLGQIGGTRPARDQDADVQLYRSDDGGKTWAWVNGAAPQFAGAGTITGDNQVWGRVLTSRPAAVAFSSAPRPYAMRRGAENAGKMAHTRAFGSDLGSDHNWSFVGLLRPTRQPLPLPFATLLAASVPAADWLRLGRWLTVGTAVYAFYGWRQGIFASLEPEKETHP